MPASSGGRCVPDERRKPLAEAPDLVAVHRDLLGLGIVSPADVADEDEAFELEEKLVELSEVRGCGCHGRDFSSRH